MRRQNPEQAAYGLSERPQRQVNRRRKKRSPVQALTQKAETCVKPETRKEELLREAICQTGAGELRSTKNRGMNIRRSRPGRVPTEKRRLPKGYKP